MSISSNSGEQNHSSQDNVVQAWENKLDAVDYAAQVEGQPEEPEPELPESEETSAAPESMLPPEAQGEANGGPLGCCLGVAIGLLLSLSVAVLSRIYATPLASVLSGNLSLIVRIVMAFVALAAAIICGYAGWKIGKKLFREYEPPVIKDRRRQSSAKW